MRHKKQKGAIVGCNATISCCDYYIAKIHSEFCVNFVENSCENMHFATEFIELCLNFFLLCDGADAHFYCCTLPKYHNK